MATVAAFSPVVGRDTEECVRVGLTADTLQTSQLFEADRKVPGSQASQKLCDVCKRYRHTSKRYAGTQTIDVHLRMQQGSKSACHSLPDTPRSTSDSSLRSEDWGGGGGLGTSPDACFRDSPSGADIKMRCF